MHSRLRFLLSAAAFVIFFAALPLAQRGGGGGGNGAAGPLTPNTPFEQFTEKLKLDLKNQIPQVQAIMTEGAKGAAPIAASMMKIREQLINLELANNAAGKPPVLASYTATAGKMAGAEAAAFGEVLKLLKPNQHEKAADAFDRMAGFFIPITQAGRAGKGPTGTVLGRLEIFATLFTLNKDQKKDIKTWFDAAHKSLADTRTGLTTTRAALAAAIQTAKSQAEIDAAAQAYAVHATAMTDAEMTALARMIQRLEPEQRANQAAIATAFGLMRGIFVNQGKWDIIPDSRYY
jgi:Spy/CpxP family protein refolding chaperone